MMFFYRLLWMALTPAIYALWWHRARRGKEDRARRPERFGVASRARPQGRLVWLHGASVGESVSLLALIDELHAVHPEWSFLVTTGTVTSATLMAQRLPPYAMHQFIPYDHPAWIARFLNHWRPSGVIWCESEIWPGLLMAIRTRAIPAVLLNGRISDGSARRWRWLHRSAERLFGTFQLIAAQTPHDAERFRHFTRAPVVELGNLKFVSAPLPVNQSDAERLRTALAGKTVWAIASTHAGEEIIAADLHWILAQKIPNLVTIIAPRHPQRVATIVAEIATRGSIVRRSAGDMPSEGIYLWDTLGEMGTLYNVVKTIAMGGSFVPIGGHNPIEPAQSGCAVICGPHMFNFTAIMDTFTSADAIISVADADELQKCLLDLWAQPQRTAALGARAQAVCEDQKGTLPRLIAALGPWRQAVANA
jgi:3-deoxy-D-manno-octulosonic-acid transferase